MRKNHSFEKLGMYKIDIANIYLGILLHYLLVLAAVLLFGY